MFHSMNDIFALISDIRHSASVLLFVGEVNVILTSFVFMQSMHNREKDGRTD